MIEKHNPNHKHSESAEQRPPNRWKLTYWLVGLGSLIWLLLRSGSKPKRLTYPCQRVAAANSIGFLAYLAALLSSATLLRRLKNSFSAGRLALLAVVLLLTVFMQGSATAPAIPILAASPYLPPWTHTGAVSNVFAITDVPVPQYSLDGGSIPGGVSADEALHDDGVDALVNLMEAHGDYFYQTAAHPDGIFDSDDVIVIKVNNQWGGKNSTNTDVLKGVIYRLVQHPDGFTGAVIIAENVQGQNPNWTDAGYYNYNASDVNQSYQDVADAFAGQTYPVCVEEWGNLRREDTTPIVAEYSAGNTSDGYVLVAGEASEGTSNRKLSYPKFQVNCNGVSVQISMKDGIWDAGSSSYDNTRLKMINMPVLKYHSASGATIAVKNYLGFLSVCSGSGSINSCSNGENRWISPGYKHCWLLSTPSADGGTCTTGTQSYGLVGRQMADIRRADLDIVDAIWVNPTNNAGYHSNAKRQDVLLASRDPFAVDYYASEYILGPLIQTYEPGYDETQSMASTHGGLFRTFLKNNVTSLRTEEGEPHTTINMNDSMTRQEELDQFNVYVAGADDPPPTPSPTLTLTAPNGGESWEIGTQQEIQWSSTGEVGNVKLEYSTNGFGVANTIAASTTDDGSYTWTIPEDPSTNVLVRVSSTLTATISDTSNSVFTIAYPTGPHPFEDSFKRVSRGSLEGGETLTYTIVLYEETHATLTLTDTIPSPLNYAGGLSVEPSWKNAAQYTGGEIRWSDTVTSTVPVTITFQAQAPITDTTWTIVNRAQISRDGAEPIEQSATSILNGFSMYLPLVLKSYQ